MEEDKTIDELWEQATHEPDAPADATAEDIPADDSDVLEEPKAEATDAPASPPAPQFDLEQVFPAFAERFQKELAPQIQSQAVEEAMRRMKQSAKARDEQIKATLAPLVAYLQQQEQQGLIAREDSNRALQEAYRNANREAEEKDRAQTEYELRQQWLSRQQQPVPTERPAWIASTEAKMYEALERSGLQETDPEFRLIPTKVTHDDPNEALDYYRVKVATAVQEKQKRLQASAKPKPLIDMGTGGGTGAGNPLAGIEDTDQLWELAMKS